MREITTHHDGAINNKVTVTAGANGPGNAPDQYTIAWSVPSEQPGTPSGRGVMFQFAKANELGVTNEILLAIVEDRLTGFQSGPFACPENGIALQAIQKAIAALKLRTSRRQSDGSEGKMVESATMPARIRIEDGQLCVGPHKMAIGALESQWNAWDRVTQYIRSLKPSTLTAAEIELLHKIPTSNAAKSGWSEAQAVLKNLGCIPKLA